MKQRVTSWTWVLLCVVLVSVSHAGVSQERDPRFDKLLDRGGLELDAPDNFIVEAPGDNDIMAYEYALRHPDKKLEVRYAIRPIDMIAIDYEDPHNSAPEPNHLFPMLFQSLISDFSRGGSSPSREYSPADAREKFRADWAAVVVLDVVPEYASEYDQALILALHKNNASDAYVIVLFDDYELLRSELDSVLTSLRFE